MTEKDGAERKRESNKATKERKKCMRPSAG